MYKNLQSPKNGLDVLIPLSSPKEELLRICSSTLNIPVTRLFNDAGKEVASIENFRDGAVLYGSQGENFQVLIGNPRTVNLLNKFVFVMLGTAAVGKSCIMLRYIWNTFDWSYNPTIEDYHTRNVVIDNEPSQVSIYDTAGMEDYHHLIDGWVENKDGLILVFSVDMPDSLSVLVDFYDKITHRYITDGKTRPLMVLAANKIDVEDRTVTSEEGRRFAEKYGMKYFEVSALKATNVDKIFTWFVKEIKKREMKGFKKKKCSNCSLL